MDSIAYSYQCAWTKLLTCARLAQKINDGVVCRLRLLGEHHVAGSRDHDVLPAARLEESGEFSAIVARYGVVSAPDTTRLGTPMVAIACADIEGKSSPDSSTASHSVKLRRLA